MSKCIRFLLYLCLLGGLPSSVAAEQVRFRFVPVDASGTMAQSPAGPDGSLGELKRGYGARALPYPQVVRPNQLVTFRHPYTGRNVTIPLRLPDGPPRLEHRADRIVYNYGDYLVEARFLTDGAVDIIYNSGFLRPLPF